MVKQPFEFYYFFAFSKELTISLLYMRCIRGLY